MLGFMILGIDEVGRGAWAGPLVIGAVIMGDCSINGLTDSKLLSPKKRKNIALEIKESSLAYGLGWVNPEEIDKYGISKSLEIGALRAIEQIKYPFSEVIIDGNYNFLSSWSNSHLVTTIKKADQLIPSVSAASVIAKVARDEYMQDLDVANPNYGFRSNVGYGTKLHQDGIKTIGISGFHRKTFLPIINNGKTTKEIGDESETIAIEFLKKQGHKLIKRNWKTKYCEIDIVTLKKDTIYFTEVKYRGSAVSGDGLEAITKSKIKKMIFAAEIFINSYNLNNSKYILAVASLSKSPMQLDAWVEII